MQELSDHAALHQHGQPARRGRQGAARSRRAQERDGLTPTRKASIMFRLFDHLEEVPGGFLFQREVVPIREKNLNALNAALRFVDGYSCDLVKIDHELRGVPISRMSREDNKLWHGSKPPLEGFLGGTRGAPRLHDEPAAASLPLPR